MKRIKNPSPETLVYNYLTYGDYNPLDAYVSENNATRTWAVLRILEYAGALLSIEKSLINNNSEFSITIETDSGELNILFINLSELKKIETLDDRLSVNHIVKLLEQYLTSPPPMIYCKPTVKGSRVGACIDDNGRIQVKLDSLCIGGTISIKVFIRKKRRWWKLPGDIEELTVEVGPDYAINCNGLNLGLDYYYVWAKLFIYYGDSMLKKVTLEHKP